MRYVFIDRHRVEFAVTTMCRVLEVSKAGFYAWRGRAPSARACDDAALLVQIQRIHKRSRATYGSPRIHAELKASRVRCGRRRVARLMRANGVRAITKRRYRVTTNSRHAEPIAPNVLNRQFAIDAVATPDRVWARDITYIATLEGWLYLAVVLDLWSRRVIGWSMRHTFDRRLATAALSMAIVGRQPPAGLLYHSDRGVQYACGDFQTLLAEFSMQLGGSAGVLGKQSQKGGRGIRLGLLAARARDSAICAAAHYVAEAHAASWYARGRRGRDRALYRVPQCRARDRAAVHDVEDRGFRRRSRVHVLLAVGRVALSRADEVAR
ncbi:MAG: family transposase, partial [Candidatus Eremiobacteraeota bacterium]|nr:family transposase [Candidatus Eremiobacteraeota bacterium]